MLSTILLAVAQTSAPPPAAPVEEIVVVGHRATDALAACLARQCPPAEDVEASLQASVEQFTAGRYDRARETLQRSIRRNRVHAAQLPGLVSSLYATLATVAEHEGNGDLWRSSARTNVALLRQYVGPSAPGTLLEEISLADTMVATGNLGSASDVLNRVERLALNAGLRDIAAGAAFRRAWLAFGQEDDKRAIKLADHAVDIAEVGKAQIATLRDILISRIALRKGDKGAVEALASRIRQRDPQQPVLLFSKPVEDINFANNLVSDGWSDSRIRFADIGYWIRPDGHTSGVEILQTSGLGQWERAVRKQVETRRYAGLDVPPGHPGVYRVDRFTIRATIQMPIGTRIKTRSGPLTTHIIDLTETEAMSAAQKRRVAEATATTS